MELNRLPLLSAVRNDAPTVTITTAEMKEFLRVDYDTDDTIIGDMITAAWRAAENWCDTVWGTRTCTAQFQAYRECEQVALYLPFTPVASLTSLTRRLYDGTTTALTEGEDFTVLFPAPNMALAIDVVGTGVTTGEVTAYTAVFEAGETTIPDDCEQAVKKMVADMYENRGANMPEGVAPIHYSVRQLLAPYRQKVWF